MTSRLLFAGSNESFYERIKAVLADSDCEITRATSLGLALFLTHKNWPSVIVLEPRLADGSAEDILAELINDPELRNTPVILICDPAISPATAAKASSYKNIKGLITSDSDDESLFRLLSQFLQAVEDRREKDPVD